MDGDKFRTFLFSYCHEGARWNLEIQARDVDDAHTRLGRLAYASYDGELKARVQVPQRFLGRLVAVLFSPVASRRR